MGGREWTVGVEAGEGWPLGAGELVGVSGGGGEEDCSGEVGREEVWADVSGRLKV